jgi:predicted phosphodiesterase
MNGIETLNPGSLLYAKKPQPRGSYAVMTIDKEKVIQVKMIYLDS